MRKARRLLVLVLLWTWGQIFAGQQERAWKVFTNRAGWSISYPSDWKIGSCVTCSDFSAPQVFDVFISSKTSDGWVVVEHLASKPAAKTAEAWLAQISSTDNQEPQDSHENLRIDGFPALKVRYRTASGNLGMEEVYVLCGGETFGIGFSGGPSSAPVNELPNYETYLKMLLSFTAKVPN